MFKEIKQHNYQLAGNRREEHFEMLNVHAISKIQTGANSAVKDPG